MEEVLQQVTRFADSAHGDQKRKYTPERYIVHPIRVMDICRNVTADVPLMAAALLHDVLEDTPTSEEDIRNFLAPLMEPSQVEQTLKLVVELTDVYVKEKYPYWNRRKRKAKEIERLERTSAESQTIKYADIIDNCTEIVSQDKDFAQVFLRECRDLLKKINKGDKGLYEQATKKVNGCLKELKSERQKLEGVGEG